MITQEEFKDALSKAIREAGSQTALAQKTGMTQSQISDYLRGRFSVENISLGSLHKLFPELKVACFRKDPAGEQSNALQEKLLEIFNALDDRGKVRLLAMAAANFGNPLKRKDEQD